MNQNFRAAISKFDADAKSKPANRAVTGQPEDQLRAPLEHLVTDLIIGERRPPSKLGDVQPDHWLAEYTTELLNLLNVIRLVKLEPSQAEVLERVCSDETIPVEELRAADAFAAPARAKSRSKNQGVPAQSSLLD